MKKAVLFSAMGCIGALSCGVASAQEVGRVISSTPVIQQVAVPRQVCNQQPVAVQQQSSGGGALLGTIIGGVIGNQMGHGFGRAAATGVGMVAGAAIGNNAEGQGQMQAQAATQCYTQTTYENRTAGYNVTYEYAGKQFTVQMPYDPGPTIRLQVSPMTGNTNSMPADTAQPVYGSGQPQAVILAQQPTMVYPAYYPNYYPGYAPVAYYPRPYYYPNISLGLGYVYHGGHRWR